MSLENLDHPTQKAAPAKSKTAKPKAEAAAPVPAIERVPGSLADARRAIGPNADFEGFRVESNMVMYLYEEPAEAPARSFSMAMAKRRLNEPQFQLKFGSLLRKRRMVGTQVTEIALDPAASENVAVADAESVTDMPATPSVDSPISGTVDAVPAPVAAAPSASDTMSPTVAPSKRRKPSALAAAALVLREAGVPMTVKEIWGVIVERELWASPNGKTPSATVAAAMGREAVKLGDQSRFLRAERGKFVANPVVA